MEQNNNCWRIARILHGTWNVDYALVDERENNKMQEDPNKLGVLITKLRLDDEEMLNRDLHLDRRRKYY